MVQVITPCSAVIELGSPYTARAADVKMADFSEAQKSFLNSLFDKQTAMVNTKIEELKAEMKVELSLMDEKLRNVRKSYDEEISQLKEKNDQLSQEISSLRKSSRKNNIIFHGLKAEGSELELTVTELMKNVLEVCVSRDDILDCYQIGRKEGGHVIVKLRSFKQKIEILRNTNKLKNTSIFCTEDLSPEDRSTQKRLLECRDVIRASGRRAFVKGLRLYIDGQLVKPEELKKVYDRCVIDKKRQREVDSSPEQGFITKRLNSEGGSDTFRPGNQ